MWITVYHSGSKCYILLTKWEKVENAFRRTFSPIKAHEDMKIVQKKFEVIGMKGRASITLFQVKGLRLRKPVPVLKKK